MRFDLICKDLEQICEQYHYQLASTQSAPSDDPFHEKIKQGLDDRLALSQRLVKRLRDSLPAEPLAVFQKRLELEEELIASIRAIPHVVR